MPQGLQLKNRVSKLKTSDKKTYLYNEVCETLVEQQITAETLEHDELEDDI